MSLLHENKHLAIHAGMKIKTLYNNINKKDELLGFFVFFLGGVVFL